MYGAGSAAARMCSAASEGRRLRPPSARDPSGKGGRDRMSVLPGLAVILFAGTSIASHVYTAGDVAQGAGWVELPFAFARKSPGAGRDWPWQWVFPATRTYRDRETGESRRHHLHEIGSATRRPGCRARAASRNESRATRCVTRSRRTSWRTATTFARCRPSLGIETSEPR